MQNLYLICIESIPKHHNNVNNLLSVTFIPYTFSKRKRIPALNGVKLCSCICTTRC